MPRRGAVASTPPQYVPVGCPPHAARGYFVWGDVSFKALLLHKEDGGFSIGFLKDAKPEHNFAVGSDDSTIVVLEDSKFEERTHEEHMALSQRLEAGICGKYEDSQQKKLGVVNNYGEEANDDEEGNEDEDEDEDEDEAILVKAKEKGNPKTPNARRKGARKAAPFPTHRRVAGSHIKHKVCAATNCNSFAKKRGVCVRHGGSDECTVRGCKTNAHARGLCSKHDANGVCFRPNCRGQVKTRGLCAKHGGRRSCSHTGCRTSAHARGLCTKHGGNGICSVQRCSMYAYSRGYCWNHAAKR